MRHWKRWLMVMAISALPLGVMASEGEGEIAPAKHVNITSNGESFELFYYAADPAQSRVGSFDIERMTKRNDYIRIAYSQIEDTRLEIKTRINEEITSYIDQVEKRVIARHREEPSVFLFLTGMMMKNDDGLFSMVVSYDILEQGDVKVESKVKSFNYDIASGKKLRLSDVGDFTRADVERGILNRVKEDEETGGVSEYFVPAEVKLSDNFFLNGKDVVVFFEPGEVAPVSYGNVQIPIGKYKSVK